MKKPFIVLTILYFVTRFIQLTVLPIFTDEAIYIYWAKFIETYKSQWFLPLTDGKPPVYIWIVSILLALFPDDLYLEAGRIAAVFFGFVTLLGIYRLTRFLFPDKTPGAPVIASLMYIFTPFTLFYDRMALFDGPLTAGLVWSTYATLNAAENPTLKNAFVWGVVLGISFLLKSTALVFWLLLPVAFMIWSIHTRTGKKQDRKLLLVTIAIALGISMGLYQSLRISSAYAAFVAKNSQFRIDPDTGIPDLLEHTVVSFPALLSWMGGWMTWPLFILGACGSVSLLLTRKKTGMVLLLLSLVPIFGFALIGQQLFPRYILFTVPFVLIPAAVFLHDGFQHKRREFRIAAAVTAAGMAAFISPFLYALYTDPVRAPMPQPDYHQYVSQHPSGYGLDQAFTIIDKASQSAGKVSVITQGTFGLYPYAFTLRYWGSDDVTILPVWPLQTTNDLPQNIDRDYPVYLVLKEFNEVPADFPVRVISVIPKPGDQAAPIIVAEY